MTISNLDDVIDSSDVEARYNELAAQAVDGALDDEELEEFAALENLRKEGEKYSPDWDYGATLVRDSYFTQYTEELINECYEMPAEMKKGEWPYCYITIDYAAAARDAKIDYTPIDFSGVTYWVR